MTKAFQNEKYFASSQTYIKIKGIVKLRWLIVFKTSFHYDVGSSEADNC